MKISSKIKVVIGIVGLATIAALLYLICAVRYLEMRDCREINGHWNEVNGECQLQITP